MPESKGFEPVEVLYEQDIDGSKSKFKYPGKKKNDDDMPGCCLYGCWFVVIIIAVIALAITVKIVRWSIS